MGAQQSLDLDKRLQRNKPEKLKQLKCEGLEVEKLVLFYFNCLKIILTHHIQKMDPQVLLGTAAITSLSPFDF